MKPSLFAIAIGLAASWCAVLPAADLSSSAGLNNHPEWAGFFDITPQVHEGEHYVPSHPGPFDPVNPNLDELVQAHLKPWALEKMKETNGLADDLGAVCQSSGIFRYPTSAGSFLWLPEKDEILMISKDINVAGVRRIYMNRNHPKNPSPSWLGDSVGRWEGDTLVVDTVSFNDKTWLSYGMEPHSEELHVIERVRKAAPDLIEIQTFVEDRQTLTSPYTFTRFYKQNGTESPEHLCNAEPGEMRQWSAWRNNALKAESAGTAK